VEFGVGRNAARYVSFFGNDHDWLSIPSTKLSAIEIGPRPTRDCLCPQIFVGSTREAIFILPVIHRVDRKGLPPTEPFGLSHAWEVRVACGTHCWQFGGSST
jgi:hypothetical protein